MRKNCFSKPPPHPPDVFFLQQFFFNVGNSMKREENLKYWKKNQIFFFQYLKNSYKIKTTFHHYQKLYSTPPWHGARTCKVSRKYINAFFSYSAKTKRDGRTDGQTDGGRYNISRPGPSAPREIKSWKQKIVPRLATYVIRCLRPKSLVWNLCGVFEAYIYKMFIRVLLIPVCWFRETGGYICGWYMLL